MKIILVLIFLGLLVALGFLGAFIWAVKSGQYTDDVSPAMRVLLEDDMIGGLHTKNRINRKSENSFETNQKELNQRNGSI